MHHSTGPSLPPSLLHALSLGFLREKIGGEEKNPKLGFRSSPASVTSATQMREQDVGGAGGVERKEGVGGGRGRAGTGGAVS